MKKLLLGCSMSCLLAAAAHAQGTGHWHISPGYVPFVEAIPIGRAFAPGLARKFGYATGPGANLTVCRIGSWSKEWVQFKQSPDSSHP